MSQLGFYFNGQRCTGCKTCELACKDYKELGTEIAYRHIYEYTGGSWTQSGELWNEDVFSYYISGACNHCDKPACLANCPQGAIFKEEDTGIVQIDVEKCIACGTCVTSCPYGAPRVDTQKNHSVKCNLCSERVAENQAPICVESCPLRALEYGDIEELRSKYGDEAAIAPLPDPSQTDPNLVITQVKQAKKSGDTSGMVANEHEVA